jgi:hypothetical protein
MNKGETLRSDGQSPDGKPSGEGLKPLRSLALVSDQIQEKKLEGEDGVVSS